MALLTIDKSGRQIPIAFGLASLVLSPSALGGPPLNDNCEEAIQITLGDTSFSTAGATTDGLSHPGQCSSSGPGQVDTDIWFTYKSDFSGDLLISTCNQADFHTRIACYVGCDPAQCPPTADDLIGCNNLASGCGGGTSQLTVQVVAGECYRIRVGGTGASGSGTLTLTQGNPACPGLGACENANGSPGCDVATCCNIVCSVDPSCCDETWSQSCAALAVDVCVALPQRCDVEGDVNLTQNADLTIVAVSGVACATAGTTVDNYFARSYDLSQLLETVDQDYTVHCVEVGIEVNTGSDLVGTVTVYVDSDGGAPTAAGIDLWPLGSKDLLIPTGSDLEILLVHFDAPILVPANSVMVVELFYPVHTNGGVWPGVNSAPESGPTYIMAPDCGVNSYMTMADVGFPEVHWVQRIIGMTCRWDLDGDGSVGILDLLALLAAWGTDPGGPPDFDGDGTVGILDLLALLANWGPCV